MPNVTIPRRRECCVCGGRTAELPGVEGRSDFMPRLDHEQDWIEDPDSGVRVHRRCLGIKSRSWYRWHADSRLPRDSRWSDAIIAAQPFEIVGTDPVYTSIRYYGQVDAVPVRTIFLVTDGEFLAPGPLSDAEFHAQWRGEEARRG